MQNKFVLTHNSVLVDDMVSLDPVELLLAVETGSVIETEHHPSLVFDGDY